MPSLIRNIAVGKASIDSILSTTGIYTCVSIVILLSENRVFVYHMDPSSFDLHEPDLAKEVQKLIRSTIHKLNEYNQNNFSIEKIFVIGGLDNELYTDFNIALNNMIKGYSVISPTIDQLNGDELTNFLRVIEYSNVAINLCGDDLDEARRSAMISDLTLEIYIN